MGYVKQLLFIMLFSVIFSSCAINANTKNNDAQIPFGDIGDNAGTIMSEYGHSPYEYPEDLTYYYQGGILEIPYVFYGGSVDSEVGFCIFIDGVLQPYSISGSHEDVYGYMHTVNIKSRSENIYILNIKPTIGANGDNLKLNFVCVDFPSTSKVDELLADLQNMSATSTMQLSFHADIPQNGFIPNLGEVDIVDISNVFANAQNPSDDEYI